MANHAKHPLKRTWRPHICFHLPGLVVQNGQGITNHPSPLKKDPNPQQHTIDVVALAKPIADHATEPTAVACICLHEHQSKVHHLRAENLPGASETLMVLPPAGGRDRLLTQTVLLT